MPGQRYPIKTEGQVGLHGWLQAILAIVALIVVFLAILAFCEVGIPYLLGAPIRNAPLGQQVLLLALAWLLAGYLALLVKLAKENIADYKAKRNISHHPTPWWAWTISIVMGAALTPLAAVWWAATRKQ